MGRPRSLNPEIAETICKRMSEGESLLAICRDPEMPSKPTVLRWAREDEAFRNQYVRAREDLLEHWAEQILDISDDNENDIVIVTRDDGSTFEKVNGDHINRSRLRVDTRKWLLSKLAPKKYGERLDLTGEVTLSLSDRMRRLVGRESEE